jgi:hypothetical protein
MLDAPMLDALSIMAALCRSRDDAPRPTKVGDAPFPLVDMLDAAMTESIEMNEARDIARESDSADAVIFRACANNRQAPV